MSFLDSEHRPEGPGGNIRFSEADQPVLPEDAAVAQPPREAGPLGHSPDSFSFRWRDLALLLGLFFAATLMLSTVLALLGFSPEALEESATAKVAVIALSQAVLSGALLAFLYLMVRSRSETSFWRALGWHPFPAGMRAAMTFRYILTGVALLVAVVIANAYLGVDASVPMEELFQNRESVLMMAGLGILIAPLVEETLFRGCLYPVLARTLGMPAGVVLTGALFGLSHALQLAGAWKQIVLLMAVGIFLTYVRARARTVVASYLVHLGYNTLLFAIVFVGTAGFRRFPTP